MPIPEDLIAECDAFIQAAYKDIIEERDNLRLRILRVDEEHDELVDLRNKLRESVQRLLNAIDLCERTIRKNSSQDFMNPPDKEKR